MTDRAHLALMHRNSCLRTQLKGSTCGRIDKNEGKFAIVNGASTGIGYELAKCCAEDGFDLLIAANEPEIHEAAEESKKLGVQSA